MNLTSKSITSTNLSPIVQTFLAAPQPFLTLSIQKSTDGRYSVEVKPGPTLWERCFSPPDPKIASTLQNLKELIGDRRLKRIFAKPELYLNLEQLENGSLELTQDTVRKIFIGLADVRFEDLAEKLSQQGRSFADLTQYEEIHALYGSLLPFKYIEDIYLGALPKIGPIDRCKSSGKGVEGLAEKTYIILSTREEVLRQARQHPDDIMISDAEMLGSRLADREPTVGAVICRPNGYFVCEKVIARNGAYVMVFRDLLNREPALVLCRGTAMRRTATGGLFSGLNDILLEIGSLGFQSVKDELTDYFRKKQIATVDIFGKSLGGAFSLFLAAYFFRFNTFNVRKVITTCSVGTPPYINNILRSAPFPIHIIRNSGDDSANEVDYIPLLGGEHPCTSSSRLFYIAPQRQGLLPENLGIPDHPQVMTKISKIFRSFSNGHNHQITLSPYVIREVKGENLAREARRGADMESVRGSVASWADFFSAGFLNDHLASSPFNG